MLVRGYLQEQTQEFEESLDTVEIIIIQIIFLAYFFLCTEISFMNALWSDQRRTDWNRLPRHSNREVDEL